MSLINEALKKAQAQRQATRPGDPPASPPPGNSRASMAAPTAGPPHLWPVLLAIAGIALLFAVGAGLIVWGLMRPVDPAVPTAAVSLEPEPESPLKAEATPSTEGVENVRTAPETEVSQPLAAESLAFSDDVSAEEIISSSAPTAPAATEGGPVEDAALPTHMSAPNPSVEAFITRLEVRGIMSGGQKALLFNHLTQRSEAYIPGSTVSNELQLKIQAITERSITFVDHDGHVYIKQF